MPRRDGQVVNAAPGLLPVGCILGLPDGGVDEADDLPVHLRDGEEAGLAGDQIVPLIAGETGDRRDAPHGGLARGVEAIELVEEVADRREVAGTRWTYACSLHGG